MDEPQTPTQKPQTNGGGDLLDLDGNAEKPYSTTLELNESPPSNNFSTQMKTNKEEINFFEDNRQATNIAIPLV